mmetsp:Transcript_5765/g.16396  ORF Transcript_5765/g.16396 Transcript_5765/m.16396 type:complete len:350 (-) Transcript_5765:99-1148(-)
MCTPAKACCPSLQRTSRPTRHGPAPDHGPAPGPPPPAAEELGAAARVLSQPRLPPRERQRFTEPLKFLPIAFVSGTMLGLYVVYVFYHCALLLQADADSRQRGWAQLLALHGLTGLVLFCYVKCILVHPGSVPDSDPRWDHDVGAAGCTPNFLQERKQSGERRHCKWCSRYKPDRCHHCRVCKTCVLKMDHHCLFINNCVGLHNYPQFLSYVFDCVVSCTFQGACLLLPVMDSIDEGLDKYSLSKLYALLLFLYCVLATFLMVRLLLDHLHQILRDVTTLEEMEADCHEGCSVHGLHSAAEPDSATALDNFSGVCGRPPAWCCPAVACIFKAFLCVRRKSWLGKAAKLD